MVMKFQDYTDNNDTNKRIECELGNVRLTKKYNMDRVSREVLINNGIEDDRNTFERHLDESEYEEFCKEMDAIIQTIQENPIN